MNRIGGLSQNLSDIGWLAVERQRAPRGEPNPSQEQPRTVMDETRFDFSSDPESSNDRSTPDREPRPFLGIRFQCCRTYGRIYRNEGKTAYAGKCPKCFAKVTVPIGSGGNTSRFFNAG